MKKIQLLLILLVSMLNACNINTGINASLKPNCTGRSGEVLIVMKDEFYDQKPGDTLFNVLTLPYQVLPQMENSLNIIHIKNNAFSDIMRRARNIIYCDIRPDVEKNEVRYIKNRFAEPQLYVQINAKNDSAFVRLIEKIGVQLKDTMVYAEKMRYLHSLSQNQNINAQQAITQKFKIKMVIPTGYNLDVNKDNFVWASRETDKSSQGLLFFESDYNGPSDFEIQNLIKNFDEVITQNVPGPTPGSFMTITKAVMPLKKESNLNGIYSCELRGLWETEGDFMGGPFVSRSIVNEKTGKLITCFSYVYGGKEKKRNLMWQNESLIETLTIANQDEQN